MLKKNNRKGFSLVEVLVAIAVLALLAVPLAQTMISSSQINSKSKDVGVASDMSNTVIESMQAIQLGDVLTEVNGYTTDNVGNDLFDLTTGDGYSFVHNALKGYEVSATYEVMMLCNQCHDRVTLSEYENQNCDQCGSSLEKDNSIIYEPVRRQTDAGVTSDADVTSSIKTRTTKNGAVRTYFTGTEDDMYDFVLRDVHTDEASYDILVHLEPEQTLNLTNITSMSQSDIVNMVQKTGMEREVANEFYQSHLMYRALHPEVTLHDASWFEANMSRQTQIDVRKDAIRDAAVITIKNIYSVPNNNVADSDKIITKVVGAYTTNSTAELARGVYYYFYPVHNNGTEVRDIISINNPEGLALNLYFISMEDGDNSPYTPELKLINGSPSLLNICSNMDSTQWSSVPSGIEIKSLGNMSEEQTLFAMDVKVYTHKESSFQNDNTFTPNPKHMLVNTGATLLDSTEKFNVNVDSEIRNPIPDDPDDPDNTDPVDPDNPHKNNTGFSDAISKSYKYDGNEHSITENNGSYVTWEGETEATDVGQYIAYAKPSDGHTWPNGSTNKKQIVWYITRDNSATAEKVDAVYDGQEHTGVNGNYIITTGDVTKTDAGNYVIYATPDPNHAWSDGTYDTHVIKWQLKPRPVTLTWETGMDKDTWYYDGVEHHGNCIVGNVVPGDTCNPNYKDNAIKELGTIKAIITSLSNPNYELPKEETTHNLSVIGAAVANVTMNPDTGTQQLIYNGQVQSGLISSSGVAISGQDTAIDAGNYTLTATPLPGYAWDKEGTDTAPRDFVWTIHQKVADIEWGQTEWVYDGVEHSTTCTVKNVDEYTPCKVLISNNHIVDVGTQPVTATLENVNYAFPNNTVRDNVLKVTTANDATFVMNDPVTYDEKTHKWGTGEHIVVTGTLEETEAGTYTVTIVPTANHAWADGTTTPITKTWIINNAKMASVSWDDYNFTGKNIVGVKLCDAQVGTCFSCGYQGAIPMVDYHGDPTKYMILHCPACDNEDQSEFEVSGGYVSGSTYASYGVGQYQGISPGQYQVIVKPNKNYAWVDGSTDEKPITWNILSNTVVKPSSIEPLLLFANPITTYEYNGKVRSPMVSTMDGTLPLSDSYFTNNAYFTVSGTRTATDAGSYTATISLKNKATSQWQDGTKDDLVINWTITKRKITVVTIPHLGERTYTDMRLFPAETTPITKQVAYEKNWDGLTFESNFNVPATLTKDVDGDDILMTKDNIIDYHFDCLPDERETEPVAANQTIYFTITDATKAYSSAGVHEYAVTAIVKDASNKNVSNNYQITYNYAWLMIHQVAIKASDITPPTAKTLTYNGNNQDLVVAGKCPYGVLEYTMDGRANTSTTENWTAYNGNNWSTLNGTNNTGWSKTIPQGKYAGQYKIYWRVDADQNHFDYTNHPNSGNIDKVDVTIQRAPQNVTLSYYSTTFCYHNISRSFNVTGRYENATFTPLTTSGPVSANQSNTNVTVYSSDSYGQGTGRVTVHTAQTANYQAGSVTFTANISDHSWVYDNTTRPWPDCTKNGTNHYHCGYDCGATTTSSAPPLAHNSVYGGTRDCHTKCSKCGGTLTGYGSHSFSSSVVKAATHTTAGTTRYTCACGYSYTVSGRPAATGHNYSYGGWYYQSGQTHARNCTCSCGHSYIEVRGHTIVYKKSGCCRISYYCSAGTGNCGHSGSSGYSSHHGMTKYVKSKKWDIWAKKYVYTYGYKCHCGYQS